MASQQRLLGAALLAAIALCLIFLNCYFWHRFVKVKSIRSELVDGKCKLRGKDYQPGLVSFWAFPIVGPSWASLHCSVELEVELDGEKVPTDKMTELTFTVPSGGLNFLPPTCSQEVSGLWSSTSDEDFSCSLALSSHDHIQAAYVGRKDKLPNLPLLLLMRALGLSFMTLGPVLCMLACMAKNSWFRSTAEARCIDPQETDADDYIRLTESEKFEVMPLPDGL
mmetsp:Transcript_34393/g.51869  ORF Transcript_34393/g.51869 Transcript_34393/m.51869 type:complete len:224 (-) Transcript_34393:49-720(-)|eukprot:CAMPEP_0206434702 /NCGR_PEP_ID=MMETSP0324_2-20121206/9353_1 /ASSEMBLY_ACC=CAM_ASM_000836 /TAXON_ID=2866 /ORGANISM="Crypthecodinium cohnii, Strain Seligo" /LENGTH=223 /DNA_ID=CAMNT_0053901343 /DNA_START=49 /DNA_END=720 /DNA_ORIENTATION=-